MLPSGKLQALQVNGKVAVLLASKALVVSGHTINDGLPLETGVINLRLKKSVVFFLEIPCEQNQGFYMIIFFTNPELQ